MISEGLDEVLVLEDDVRFEPYFRFKLQMVLNELRRLKVPWDLVYVYYIFVRNTSAMRSKKKIKIYINLIFSIIILNFKFEYTLCLFFVLIIHYLSCCRYIGRKPLNDDDEMWLKNSKLLIRPGYSYWTIGYLLSGRGAKKLLNADPLKNLLPVDEFLPIMFNKHPQ